MWRIFQYAVTGVTVKAPSGISNWYQASSTWRNDVVFIIRLFRFPDYSKHLLFYREVYQVLSEKSCRVTGTIQVPQIDNTSHFQHVGRTVRYRLQLYIRLTRIPFSPSISHAGHRFSLCFRIHDDVLLCRLTSARAFSVHSCFFDFECPHSGPDF